MSNSVLDKYRALAESPLPSTYEAAIGEIMKLRNMLITTNEARLKAVMQRQLDSRSLKGQIKTLQQENAVLKAENTRLKEGL